MANNSARANGWYWVVFGGFVQAAYYYEITRHWEICGSEAELLDSSFDTIGTRIPSPDEARPAPAEPPAGVVDIAALKSRIDTRLNNHLCDMREGWDDSVVGFNTAWDIVREVFAALTPKERPDVE